MVCSEVFWGWESDVKRRPPSFSTWSTARGRGGTESFSFLQQAALRQPLHRGLSVAQLGCPGCACKIKKTHLRAGQQIATKPAIPFTNPDKRFTHQNTILTVHSKYILMVSICLFTGCIKHKICSFNHHHFYFHLEQETREKNKVSERKKCHLLL